VYTQSKIEAHWHNSCCRGKAVNNTYSECVSSASLVQHTKSMNGIMCPARHYHILPHCLIKGKIFGSTLLNIKCVLWLSVQLSYF